MCWDSQIKNWTALSGDGYINPCYLSKTKRNWIVPPEFFIFIIFLLKFHIPNSKETFIVCPLNEIAVPSKTSDLYPFFPFYHNHFKVWSIHCLIPSLSQSSSHSIISKKKSPLIWKPCTHPPSSLSTLTIFLISIHYSQYHFCMLITSNLLINDSGCIKCY